MFDADSDCFQRKERVATGAGAEPILKGTEEFEDRGRVGREQRSINHEQGTEIKMITDGSRKPHAGHNAKPVIGSGVDLAAVPEVP